MFDQKDSGSALVLRRLAKMIEVALPANVAKAMLASCNLPDLSLNQRRYLSGPVIIHQSPFSNDMPKDVFQHVIKERLLQVAEELEKGVEGTHCGPIGIMAALYGASFEAPLRSEIAELYLWSGAHYLVSRDGITIEKAREKAMSSVPDESFTRPNGRYYPDWRELSYEIRRKVVAAQAERDRAHDRETKATTKGWPVSQPSADQVESVQLSIF